jgi:hypothetical protein
MKLTPVDHNPFANPALDIARRVRRAEGGGLQRTAPFPEKPEGYEFYGPNDNPVADQPVTQDAAAEIPSYEAPPQDAGPVAGFLNSLAAPSKYQMEPGLQNVQMDSQETPEGYAVNDAGETFNKSTGEVMPQTRRPGLLPITMDPEGKPEFAMPKIADIASNIIGGNVPGGGMVLGSGFARAAKAAAPVPNELGFYSAVEHAVNTVGPAKASPEQWLGTIKNTPGVKQEELQWTGLEDWLKQQKGPVTKDQVQDYIKNNQIELQTVQKGAADPVAAKAASDRETQAREEFDAYAKPLAEKYDLNQEQNLAMYGTMKRMEPAEVSRYEELQHNWIEAKDAIQKPDTKFGSYIKNKGENYGETLLTMPPKIEDAVGLTMNDIAKRLGYNGWTSSLTEAQKAAVEKVFASQKMGPTQFNARMDAIQEEMRMMASGPNRDPITNKIIDESRWHVLANERDALQAAHDASGEGQFESGHWDEPNVLANVLHSDRMIGDKKYLQVHEVQSDWHQKGQAQGYKGTGRDAAIIDREIDANRAELQRRELYNNSFDLAIDWQDAWDKHPDLYAREQELYRERGKLGGSAVPDAPFKSTWHELAMKRMMKYASDNNYDGILVDKGSTVADRYDLSRQISAIHYERTGEGKYEIEAYDKSDRKILHEDEIPIERVQELVGKDMAKRIESDVGEKTGGPYRDWRILQGLDLKVGGEFHKKLYDEKIPQALNKLGKKYGAKVGETKLNPGRSSKVGSGPLISDEASIHKFDITPALRNAAKTQGFPQFFKGGSVKPRLVAVAHDPFETPKAIRRAMHGY